MKIEVLGYCDRFLYRIDRTQAARMVARGQAAFTADGGQIRILGFGEGTWDAGGGTRTASGGLVPRQVYTTRNRTGAVDGYKRISPLDLPVFQLAVLDSLK